MNLLIFVIILIALYIYTQFKGVTSKYLTKDGFKRKKKMSRGL